MWKPHQKELEKQRPISSVYRVDFTGGYASKPMQQKLTVRPKTSFDDAAPTTTSYRYGHGPDNPHKRTLSAMCNVGLTTTQNRRHRVKSVVADGGSVASCMNWYQPQPPSRPNVPRATSTVVLTPPAEVSSANACVPATVPLPPPPPPVPVVKLALTE